MKGSKGRPWKTMRGLWCMIMTVLFTVTGSGEYYGSNVPLFRRNGVLPSLQDHLSECGAKKI